MRDIPITATANQKLTVTIDLTRFTVTLKAAVGCMTCTIEIDGVEVLTGSRVLAGEMLIPYRYRENGNFILMTEDDALPDWTEFGSTQFLRYLTPDEMDAIRG